MNRRIARPISKVIALLLVVGGIALVASGAEAFDVFFGMFGLFMGQTARLNVVSIDNPDLRPGDCMVELSFLDGMGMTHKMMTETLMRGHAAFLDLAYDDIPMGLRGGTTSPLRVQLRAMARAIDNPNTKRNKCMVVPTGEVYDNESMMTMFLFGLTPMIQPPDPTMPAPGR